MTRLTLITILSLVLLAAALVLLVRFIQYRPVIQHRPQVRQWTAGDTVFVSPGENLQAEASSLRPGDTLILRDGIYNSHLTINDVHGSAKAPITIKAEHDGQAIIDGGGNPDYQAVAEINGSSYIVLQGVVVRNGGGDVVGVYNKSNDITIRRVTAYNAGRGNHHVFDVEAGRDGSPNNVLVEDCAGWGNGRYNFIAYHATNVTFRRNWARWTSQSNFSPAPRSCYGIYGSSNDVLENDICLHDIPDRKSSDYFTAIWETSDGPATDNNTYRGLIFYDNWEGFWVNGSAGKNTQITNSLFMNNRQQGTTPTSKNHGDGIMWGTSNGGSVTNSTFVNNEIGFNKRSGNPTLSNNVFVGNDLTISGNPKSSDLVFWQNKNTRGSTGQQSDPGYDTNKYGRGTYLFIPPNSTLKSANIGANILYQYQDGQLTTKPLWPWPMEERIKAETGMSATWESGGGLWKTLDGVYGTGCYTKSSENTLSDVVITQPPSIEGQHPTSLPMLPSSVATIVYPFGYLGDETMATRRQPCQSTRFS